MKVHEFQAKQMMRAYQIPVPNGKVATTPEEAKDAVTQIGGTDSF